MYDLIIIGGGPAALSAARFALGKQLHVVMVYEELGGKIGWLESLIGPEHSEDMPGNELAHLLATRVTAKEGNTLNDQVIAMDKPDTTFRVVTKKHGTLYSKAILIATGAAPLPLNVSGADQFLEKGLGYSITSHAHLVAGQRIAVIGATPRALSGVAEIATTAAHVYLVAPHTQWLGSPLGKALQTTPSVEILGGYEVIEIGGDDKLRSVTVTLGATTRRLDVDHVFVALGVVPNSQLVRHLVETDAHGYILVNGFHKTSLRGLYAAGDVSTLFSEQVIIAIGDGARAARTAYDYLLAERLVPEHV